MICRNASGNHAMNQPFDRAAEDLGNSVHFEHVNVQVPDQHLATLFYVTGLGLTRDPYLMVSDTNMWVNVGRSQFHLPSGKAQVLRGRTGLVISGRAALLDRLPFVARGAARRCSTGSLPSPGGSTARRSHSPSITTTSRQPVRGAIACAVTSRTPIVS